MLLWTSLEISRSCSCQGCSSEKFLATLALGLLQDPVFSFQYFSHATALLFSHFLTAFYQEVLQPRHALNKTQPTAANRNFRDSMSRPCLICEQCKNNLFTNLLGNCQQTQVTKGGQSLLHHQDSVALKWRASNSSLFFLKTAQLTFLPAPLQYPFKLYPAAWQGVEESQLGHI